MTDVHTTKSTLNMRRRRVKARAEGKCINCCKNPARPNRVACTSCAARSKIPRHPLVK